MNRVIILDPSCDGDPRTHHINAVKGHAHFFTLAGFKVMLWANDKNIASLKGIETDAIFPYTIYDDARKHYTGKGIRILRQPCYFLMTNKVYRLIVESLDACHIKNNDHLFIPTLDWILFQALLKLYTGNKDLLPSLHLLLMYEQADWMIGGYPYMKILRGIYNLRKHRKNIFVYTETKKHALSLLEPLEMVPDNYPFPALPLATNKPGNNDNNTIYISVMGGGRRDKGYHQLPDIIRTFNNIYTGNKKVVFTIQTARKEDQLERETMLLREIGNVKLLDNRITADLYETNLRNSHIAIFPYSSSVYATRGSGTVNEAVANSIPIICPHQTALAEVITCNNGLLATTAEQFAQAINNVITRLDFYTAQAKIAKEYYLESLYHNPVIRDLNSSRAS